MNALMVASTTPYSGKSGICHALLEELGERQVRTAYFKPFGTMPVAVEDVLTDQDAAYVSRAATIRAPLDSVCPVVATQGLIEDVLSRDAGGFREIVGDAFGIATSGADVAIIEGPGSLASGRSLELDVCGLAGLFDAKVLLVDRPSGRHLPDEVLIACDCLGNNLQGVLFNAVPESIADHIGERFVPFLKSRDIPVFGVLPKDSLLSSVTVTEIVEELSGTVLSAEHAVDEPVESFMVGAMGQDKALRYFRRRARKAVITGGDRADVQLAALETDTRCIILTGNLPPSSLVLARAEELGVPMVLVGFDTLTAVEKMESLLGRVRLHDPRKAGRIRQILREEADLDALLEGVL